MNEVIAWYAPCPPAGKRESVKNGNIRDTDHAYLETAIHELGMKTAISEDIENLRLLLSGQEPVLLIAELQDAEGWAGWSAISEVREEGKVLPVIVISEAGVEKSGAAAVSAFNAGANDHLARPVHTGELKCRVMNLLKLTGRRGGLPSLLKVDGLLLDPGRRQVSRDGIELKLTPKEFDLLYYLAAHLGEICPRNEILSQVWGYQFHADTNVVDVYIRHIRMKVDKGYRNKLIHTVRGTGYILLAP